MFTIKVFIILLMYIFIVSSSKYKARIQGAFLIMQAVRFAELLHIFAFKVRFSEGIMVPLLLYPYYLTVR